ncbi:hypothetical protein LCL89_14050 [Halobacillus yeomjeoni]|uniref:TcaA NTF2-like domain-containing protein n=1 Tax=Halobacillus yeomjeoni TaxID=311194 RepID=UPI001CD596DE|nr:hypothetical protein [Halobacillus yeomjeoni]MCA0985150.1 hypothetical protein [Halobacillus yeomjeoni]
MEFCTSCGNRLGNGVSFCTNCGAKHADKTVDLEEDSTLVRKQKRRWWIDVTAAVLLMGAHLTMMSMFDPMKDVQAMDRALNEQDADRFLEFLKLDEDALIHPEEFLRFVDESGWEDVRTQMMDVIQSKGSNAFDVKIYDSYGHPLWIMKKKAIVPGLYHTYQMEVIPDQLLISNTYGPAAFSIEEETMEVEAADAEVRFIKLYPGEYEMEIQAENEFGQLTISDSIVVDSLGGEEITYYARLPEERYRIVTDHEDAVLFVNGESTGKMLEEYEELGPFLGGEETEVHAEWTNPRGEIIKTDPLYPADAYRTDLAFIFDQPIVEKETESVGLNDRDAEELVLNFRKAYEEALNNDDYSRIDPYIAAGSQADKDLKEYLNDMRGADFSYNFTDNKVLAVEETSDGVVVTTEERFIFTNHKGDQIEYYKNKDYYLKEEAGTYKITLIEITFTERNHR